MDKGWIKLHRKILDCEIFAGEPFSKMQAWIYLLLMANHEPKEIFIGYQKVRIERGQLHTSERKLATIWGWDFRKVKRFLDVLQMEKMLSRNSSAHGSTLTIVNYDIYQVGGSTHGSTLGSTDGSTDGTQTRNKEIKNIYISIVEHLNTTANKHFKVSEKTKSLIDARLNEGFVLEDFYKVIDTKTAQWLNDSKMNSYLRPITLFSNKFESYLNEQSAPAAETPKAKNKFNKIIAADYDFAALERITGNE